MSAEISNRDLAEILFDLTVSRLAQIELALDRVERLRDRSDPLVQQTEDELRELASLNRDAIEFMDKLIASMPKGRVN